MNKPSITELLSILKKDYPAFLETTIQQAGAWGSSLHQALECINNEIEFEINNCDDIFKRCIDNYTQWKLNNKIKIIYTEKEVENEYCKGHIDCIADINNLTIIDYKTGVKDKLWKLQLAGYWLLYGNSYAQGLVLSFDKKIGDMREEYYTAESLKTWSELIIKLVPIYNFIKNKEVLYG